MNSGHNSIGIVKVNGFEIGGQRTFIIADIGSNHKQDLQLAKDSIDAAAAAGADAIKFQSIQLNELYRRPDKKTAEFVKQLEFPEEWHSLLKEYCDQNNVLFFSSPTYLKAVDLLEAVNVPIYKLASAQVGTFPQVVEKVAALQKPTIFSTGIVNYEQITEAVEIFRKYGNDQFMILHCNSIYPTPPEKVNLRLINTYKQMFGSPVGFSDHTNGIHISLAAVALGANIIEKHFTLRRDLGTPDCSSFASDPAEFTHLVQQVREIESTTNTFNERLTIQDEETEFKESIRYRIVAGREILKGEIIAEDMLVYLRDTSGIDCRDVGKVIGKMVKKSIPLNELINYDNIT